MKNVLLISIITATVVFATACSKDQPTERFKLLTGQVWQSDSLLVDGQDASLPGLPLAKFVGDAEFKTDYTGYFGQYKGTWYFSNNENNITIVSDSLVVPLTSGILELSATSFKIATTFPITGNPQEPNEIRITFRAKQ